MYIFFETSVGKTATFFLLPIILYAQFFLFFFFRGRVSLYCPHQSAVTIHSHDPTTDQHQSFNLLLLTWASSPFLRQPGGPPLPGGHHIGAELSADTQSA